MNSTVKIFTALVAGVAAGMILGVLLAPDKGSETRRKINEQGKKLTDDLKHKFNKGKEKFNNMKEDMEESLKAQMKEFA